MKEKDDPKKQHLLIIVVCMLIGITVVAGILFYRSRTTLTRGDGECNANYTGACVPNVSYDIDCKAVKQQVKVVGKDVYHFDADGTGSGCESY